VGEWNGETETYLERIVWKAMRRFSGLIEEYHVGEGVLVNSSKLAESIEDLGDSSRESSCWDHYGLYVNSNSALGKSS
jgi:hypothetical protein